MTFASSAGQISPTGTFRCIWNHPARAGALLATHINPELIPGESKEVESNFSERFVTGYDVMSDTLSFVDADVGHVTDDGVFENFVAYFLILQGLWIRKI